MTGRGEELERSVLIAYRNADEFYSTNQQQKRKDAVQISYQALAESIGVSKSSAQAAAGWLVRRKLLAANKENATAVPVYTVMRPWIRR